MYHVFSDDPVGCSETDMLKKEADMPLDQLLAQYKNYVPDTLNSHEKEDSQSPALKARSEATSDVGSSSQVEETGPSSSSSVSIPSSLSLCHKQNSSLTVPNGAGNLKDSSRVNQSQTKDRISTDSEKHLINNNSIGDNITSHCNRFTSSVADEHLSPSSPNGTHFEAADNQHGKELTPGGGQAEVADCSLPAQHDGSADGCVPSMDSNVSEH